MEGHLNEIFEWIHRMEMEVSVVAREADQNPLEIDEKRFKELLAEGSNRFSGYTII